MCDRFISFSSEMLTWLVIINGCKVWDLRQDHGMLSLFKMAKVCPHPPRDYLPISPLSLSLLIYFTTFLFHRSLYNSLSLLVSLFFLTPPLDPFFSFSILLVFSTVIHGGYFRGRKIISGLRKKFSNSKSHSSRIFNFS